MFSLGMINFESLSTSILFSLNNRKCDNMVTYTAKLYNNTIPNKGSQVIDSPASSFEGLRYRETDMVNSNNYYKLESLKAKRYTLQSSNPMHPSKNGVNSLLPNIHAYRKSLIFVTRWYCTYKHKCIFYLGLGHSI